MANMTWKSKADNTKEELLKEKENGSLEERVAYLEEVIATLTQK